MVSQPRQQEREVASTSFGLRWFKLDANLTATGSALAYSVYYDRNAGYWNPQSQPAGNRLRIYSPAEGITASQNDVVPCTFNPASGHWELLYPGAQGDPSLSRFKLTGNLEIGGSTNAVLRTYDGGAWVDGSTILVFDSYGSTTQSPGGTHGRWTGVSGMEGIAYQREPESSSYDIVWMEQYARLIAFTFQSPRMELSDDAGFATIDYIVDGIIPPLNGDSEILVHDDQELFPHALGTDYAMEGGAKGWAIRNDRLGSAENPYYQVVSCDQRCRRATARLGQTMCGETHFQVLIEGFESADKAPFSQVPKPLPTTVYNPFRHRARNDGRRVFLEWMKVPDQNAGDGSTVEGFCIVQVPMNKRKVTFDYRISADKTKLEALRAECAVEYCEDPQWEQIVVGKTCT